MERKREGVVHVPANSEFVRIKNTIKSVGSMQR